MPEIIKLIQLMRTFILNAVERLKNYSQKLDAKAILFDKSWEVFNETGDKELIIFRANSELLISRNGIVQKGKWELLDIANMLIDVNNKSYLLNAAYIEDKFLALKLDGTNQFMVMIEADMKDRFSMNSVNAVEQYLEDRYKKIEAKKTRKLEEKRQLQIEEENAENRRLELVQREEKERKLQEKRQKNIQEKKEKMKEELYLLMAEELRGEEIRELTKDESEIMVDLKRSFKAVRRRYIEYIFYSVFNIVVFILSPITTIILSYLSTPFNEAIGMNYYSQSDIFFLLFLLTPFPLIRWLMRNYYSESIYEYKRVMNKG